MPLTHGRLVVCLQLTDAFQLLGDKEAACKLDSATVFDMAPPCIAKMMQLSVFPVITDPASHMGD